MYVSNFFKYLFAKHAADIALTAGRGALREDIEQSVAAALASQSAPSSTGGDPDLVPREIYNKVWAAYRGYRAEAERLAIELAAQQKINEEWRAWYEAHVTPAPSYEVTDDDV